MQHWVLDAFYHINFICLIFWFENLPYLLSFYLFNSLNDIAETGSCFAFLNLPAKAALITETVDNTPGTKSGTVNPCAVVSLYTNLHIPTKSRVQIT